MAEERPLDPRFDPRFQRGFDPATMPVEPEKLRAPLEDAGPVPPLSPVPPAAEHEAGRRQFSDDEDDDDELEERPTRNPFRLALLLVSIGLLVLAGVTLWWSANNQSAYLFGSAVEAPQGWMFQQLTTIVPPAAIVAGFVGFAIWLGLGALTARTSPRPDASSDEQAERPRDE